MIDIFTFLLLLIAVFGVGYIFGSRKDIAIPQEEYNPYDPMEFYRRTDHTTRYDDNNRLY